MTGMKLEIEGKGGRRECGGNNGNRLRDESALSVFHVYEVEGAKCLYPRDAAGRKDELSTSHRSLALSFHICERGSFIMHLPFSSLPQTSWTVPDTRRWAILSQLGGEAHLMMPVHTHGCAFALPAPYLHRKSQPGLPKGYIYKFRSTSLHCPRVCWHSCITPGLMTLRLNSYR